MNFPSKGNEDRNFTSIQVGKTIFIYLLGLALYEELLGTSRWVNLPAQVETSSFIYLTQGVSISIDDQRNTSVLILLREVSYFSPQKKQ